MIALCNVLFSPSQHVPEYCKQLCFFSQHFFFDSDELLGCSQFSAIIDKVARTLVYLVLSTWLYQVSGFCSLLEIT